MHIIFVDSAVSLWLLSNDDDDDSFTVSTSVKFVLHHSSSTCNIIDNNHCDNKQSPRDKQYTTCDNISKKDDIQGPLTYI